MWVPKALTSWRQYGISQSTNACMMFELSSDWLHKNCWTERSRLTKKQVTKFQWTLEAQEAFAKLKDALCAVSAIAFPLPNVPCILDTDAFNVAVEAILNQNIEGEEHPITFFSRVLGTSQQNYCTTRRESCCSNGATTFSAIICWELRSFYVPWQFRLSVRHTGGSVKNGWS